MDLPLENQEHGEIDRSNDWTVFEAKDGSKCLNTGVSIYKLLDGDQHAAQRMVSKTEKSSRTGEPLLLYPYQNAKNEVIVEPGNELLSGSMPFITVIMARIAANEPWKIPKQSASATMKQSMATSRARFDIQAGADEAQVIKSLKKTLDEIDLEEESSEDVSFSDIRAKFENEDAKKVDSQPGGSESGDESSSSSARGASTSSEGEIVGDGFDGPAQTKTSSKFEENVDRFDAAVAGAGLNGEDETNGVPLQVGNGAGALDTLKPVNSGSNAGAQASSFGSSYGRMDRPASSFGFAMRDLHKGGEHEDDSDFGSEEQRAALEQEAKHIANLPDFVKLMEASSVLDAPIEDEETTQGAIPAMQNQTEGTYDQNGVYHDRDGGRVTPNGTYYDADGVLRGVFDELGGIYDAQDGSYTDADGKRFSAEELEAMESNDEQTKDNDTVVFNGQRLPVINPSGRRERDLVGLSARDARRVQRERERDAQEIEKTRRTINQMQRDQEQKAINLQNQTVGLTQFGLPEELAQKLSDKQVDISQPIADFTDIEHLAMPFKSSKADKYESNKAEPVPTSATDTKRDFFPGFQETLQTLPLEQTDIAKSDSKQQALHPSDKILLLKELAKANEMQLQAGAAQWGAFAKIMEHLN